MSRILLVARAIAITITGLVSLFVPAAMVMLAVSLLGPGARASDDLPDVGDDPSFQAPAWLPRPELQIHYASSRHHSNSVWHQKGWGPYKLTTAGPGGSLGVRGTIFEYDKVKIGYRVGSTYLLRHKTYCECTMSDEEYFRWLREGGEKRGPTSKFWTHGDTFGYYAALTVSYGPAWFSVGANRLGTSNTVVVKEPSRAGEPGWSDGGRFSGYNGRYWNTTPRVELGVEIGKGVSAFVGATKINNQQGAWYPITKGRVWFGGIGVVF